MRSARSSKSSLAMEIARADGSARIDIGFLASYLRSPAVREELAKGSKGLGLRRQRVHPETLLAHSISLPPLDEQRTIRLLLEKIDAIAAQHVNAASRIAALGVS